MMIGRKQLLLAAASLLLLSSLACRTLLGGPAPQPADNEAEVRVEPTETQPAPTATAYPLDRSGPARLDGQDLPELDFGPPGFSPRDRSRPRLSGDPQTLDSEHFRIHYTLSGYDAVEPDDANNNGHPDYVEDVARALEYSWRAQIEHFGWLRPPEDGDLGGDGRSDVYLAEIFDEGSAGYVDSDYEDGFYGDNPNSETVEYSASSSFMVLDNDYLGYDDDPLPGITRLEYMQSTAAHELLHVIQYGYDAEEPHDWLWEATATWIQDEVFNQVNDGNQNLSAVFKSPDSCQLAYGGDDRVEDSDHWYGLWVFLRYISERYDHETVRQVWEAAALEDGYAAWDLALAPYQISLEQLVADFSLALLTRDFEEGSTYPVVRLEGRADSGETFEPRDGVAQLGADYIEIMADGLVRVELDSSGLDGLLVGLDGRQASAFPMEGGATSVDAAAFDHLYLVVLNLDRAANESGCRFTNYAVEIAEAGEAQSAAVMLEAANFQAPRVESLKEPGSGPSR